ncbi:MAG: PPC domain-containing DNA-binding protein [Patescibacteria group bacterium]|jgi:predicted DNA-binding protein with PD1-like motif
MNYVKTDNKYIIKIKKGEKIVESLKRFCEGEKIQNGIVSGVGAVDRAELAHYRVDAKKYTPFVLEEALELISLNGNVFLDEDKTGLIIHLHSALGRPSGEMIGGHLVEARVAAACEILFENTETSISKKYDEETGLKLMDL